MEENAEQSPKGEVSSRPDADVHPDAENKCSLIEKSLEIKQQLEHSSVTNPPEADPLQKCQHITESTSPLDHFVSTDIKFGFPLKVPSTNIPSRGIECKVPVSPIKDIPKGETGSTSPLKVIEVIDKVCSLPSKNNIEQTLSTNKPLVCSSPLKKNNNQIVSPTVPLKLIECIGTVSPTPDISIVKTGFSSPSKVDVKVCSPPSKNNIELVEKETVPLLNYIPEDRPKSIIQATKKQTNSPIKVIEKDPTLVKPIENTKMPSIKIIEKVKTPSPIKVTEKVNTPSPSESLEIIDKDMHYISKSIKTVDKISCTTIKASENDETDCIIPSNTKDTSQKEMSNESNEKEITSLDNDNILIEKDATALITIIDVMENDSILSKQDDKEGLIDDLPSNQFDSESKNSMVPKTNEWDIKTDQLNEDIKGKIIGVIHNDSENTNDSCDKESGKAISRELKSLIASAKDSKIINECTQIKNKVRKSRCNLDISNSSFNTSSDPEKITNTRRASINSQQSNSSEKSESTMKRSMRSQNPEFVSKQKQFLNSVTGKANKDAIDVSELDSGDDTKHNKIAKRQSIKITNAPENKLRCDPNCWRCHWAVEQETHEKAPVECTVCPRSFHYKCLNTNERTKITMDTPYVCPECMTILHSENTENRSQALKKISLGKLSELLQYAWDQMCTVNGAEPFMSPVDRNAFPNYDQYVVHSVDLSLMKDNIKAGLYGSTEAFVSDAQWILHNSIIFNTVQSKLTTVARSLLRTCRLEMVEIEACPECYLAAHARRPTWFTDVCTTPHILLWAKLKGFPYWPAKGMSLNNSLVDVRFFGAHDRAWVPARDCFLYSVKDPNNFRTKRQDILDSMQEADHHIRNISRKFGSFVHAPFKTQFDPSKLEEQLKSMIPGFQGEVTTLKRFRSSSAAASPARVKEKRRSASKSSNSVADGDASEEDDTPLLRKRKTADGAEISSEQSSDGTERDMGMEIELCNIKINNGNKTRKRRRSQLQEAVITIIDSSKPKRKRLASCELTSSNDSSTLLQNKDNTDDIETSNNKEEIKALGIPKFVINKASLKAFSQKANKDNMLDSSLNLNEIFSPKSPKNKSMSTSSPKARHKEKYIENKETQSLDEITKPTYKDKTVKSNLILTQADQLAHKRREKRRHKKKENSNINDISKTNKNTSKNNDIANKSLTPNMKEKFNKEKPTNDQDKHLRDRETKEKLTKEMKEKSTKEKVIKDKSVKDKLVFDNDSNIAIHENTLVSVPGLPTISNVRSLVESPASTSDSSNTNSRLSQDKLTNVPTSKADQSSLVGRVGVRSFARMPTPLPEKESSAHTNSDQVMVEVKAEPMDLDDPDRHNEKLDLLKTFKLRPVNHNQPPTSLRDVRVNKTMPPYIRKIVNPSDMRTKARKTFPQAKKSDDGRSELNSKNSMVYIPIKPPATQAPPPLKSVNRPNGPTVSSQALSFPRLTNTVSSGIPTSLTLVNTVTTPVLPMVSLQPSMMTTSTIPTSTIAQTGVHTLPMITTVNGQWTLALQPMMSLGNVDGSPPMLVNGIADRTVKAVVSSASNMDTSSNQLIEPPRLMQRPLMNPLDPLTPVGELPTPSFAGQVTAKLNQNAVKLADFFRNLLEDSIAKLDTPGTNYTHVKIQMEHMAWKHKQEILELKHNHELMMAELRATIEREKTRIATETRRSCQIELDAVVLHTKSKQWCANCRQEAQFYCCWNTSYCDYPCQRAHWSQHFSVCSQQRPQDSTNERRMNPIDTNFPTHVLTSKSSSSIVTATVSAGRAAVNIAPVISHPNKTLGNRGNNKLNAGNKQSLIVSMVEDSSGNSTVKCLGSYNPAVSSASTTSPIIINNQLRNAEDHINKVVTTGGYLIVGPPTSPTSSVIIN